MTGEPLYSVVIPVFNSSVSLPELNRKVLETMHGIGHPFEVIYIDDCSGDSSWDVLRKLRAESDHLRIIRLARNVGQWMALICGVANSKGEHIITMDDDLEYDPADIKLLLDKYHSGDLAIVYGIPGDKSKKNLSNKLFFRLRANLLDFILGKNKTESFRVFKRSLFIDPKGRRYSGLHFEAHAKHAVSQRLVGYVPVSYRNRPHGRSGYGLIKKIRLILRFGPEHLISPFRYWILASMIIILLLPFIFLAYYLGLRGIDTFYNLLTALILGFILLGIGILGSYLVKVFFILKGYPDYVILEEI